MSVIITGVITWYKLYYDVDNTVDIIHMQLLIRYKPEKV